MCGRYTVLTEQEIIEIREILQEISLRIVNDEFHEYSEKPGEVRPTNQAPVIAKTSGGISFENQKWGFKKWKGSGVIINARSESIKSKSMFSNLLNTGRCVVPAASYFEWEKTESGKKKHYVKDKEGNLLFMAGLYRDTEEGREFVIITKESSGDVSKIHDRMPVVLKVSQIEPWLTGELSPDDLPALDIDISISPCGDENVNAGNKQLSLWDDENE